MGKYGAYERYKDSGVEWLGEIPEHWEIWKVAHGFKNIGSGTTPKSNDPSFYGGDIPWITTSELRENLILDTAQKVTQEALKNYSSLKVYSKNSVAIAMYGATIGRLGILGIDAAVNQACCVFSEPKVFHLPFFYYCLWMYRPNLIGLSAGGGQPNLSQDNLKQLRLPTPPLDEQETIAQFLDYKTKQIDELITKKEAIVEKLDEKRTALISHAVTKGLDPDVAMKDSGVEWLGEIPRHWEVKSLRHICEFLNRRRIPLSSEYRGSMSNKIYPYYGASGIIDYVEDFIFNEPTILIAEDGANLLSRSTPLAFIADGKYWVNNHAHILKPFAGEFRFWANLLCVIQYDNWITGSAQPKLTKDNLANIKLPTPPLHEQKAIAQFLDQKTEEIDQQKTKIKEGIELLKEYRTALITNAVTGKIDVRQIPK